MVDLWLYTAVCNKPNFPAIPSVAVALPVAGNQSGYRKSQSRGAERSSGITEYGLQVPKSASRTFGQTFWTVRQDEKQWEWTESSSGLKGLGKADEAQRD